MLKRVAITTALLLLALSCGDERPPANKAHGIVAGQAWKGAVADATVTVYRNRGPGSQTLVASGLTDAAGAFSIDIESAGGDLLVKVTGGSFVDEATGGIVHLDQHELSALVLGFGVGFELTDLTVSPATHWTRVLAESYVSGDQSLELDEAVAKAAGLLEGHFSGVDLDATVPVDLTAGDVGSFTNQSKYGLILSALSQLAADISLDSGVTPGVSITPISLCTSLAQDLEDSKWDGTRNGTPLTAGNTLLDSYTTRLKLATAGMRWLSNENDQSGLAPEDVSTFLNVMAMDSSELYPFDKPPRPMDQVQPEITVESPADGSTVAGSVALKATATDDVELGSLVIEAPVGIEDTDADADAFEGTWDSTAVADGEVTITFRATDAAGNVARESVTVTVRNTGGISGFAFKGAVSGATVTAQAWNPGHGSPTLATAVTDADGGFILDTGDFVGPLLIVVDSGTYVEEALGTEVDFERGDYLSALIGDFDPSFQGPVVVSSLTTWAAEYAEYIALDDAALPLADAASQANEAISKHFGDIDILGTRPADISAGVSCSTLTEPVRYALYHAGLSQLAENISIDSGLTPGAVVNAISLTDEIADDITDGIFNGKKGARKLLQGNYELSSYTVRTDLARAINDWLASQDNPCGLSVEDAFDVVDDLAEDDGFLFPDEDPVIPVDEEGPAIEFTSHEDGEAVAGTVTVEASASDPKGVAKFEIVEPAGVTDDDLSLDGISFDVDTAALADGDLIVTLSAEDTIGNISEGTITLVVDNTGPILEFVPASGSGTNETPLTITGTVTDAAGVASLKLDGADLTVGDNGEFTTSALALVDGENTFLFVADDVLDNETAETYTVHLDRVPPEIDITSPTDGNSYPHGITVDISASASDTNGIVSLIVLIDDAPLEDQDPAPEVLSASIETDDHAEGALELVFVALDSSGNEHRKPITIHITRSGFISGQVWKGVVSGATVQAFDFTGCIVGDEVAQADNTSDSGNFALVIGSFSGPVLLVAKNGSYLAEAIEPDTELQLDAGRDELTAIVEYTTGDTTSDVIVSPATSFIASLTERYCEEAVPFDDALQRARYNINTFFGFDVETVTPKNPSLGPVCGITAQSKYGLILAGLSQLGVNISTTGGISPGTDVTAISISTFLDQDLRYEGVFNGWGASGQFVYAGHTQSSYTVRTDLPRAILDFLRGPRNQSGISANLDMYAYLDTLAESTLEIFPDDPIIPVDNNPPEVTWNSPTNGERYRGSVLVDVSSTDDREMAVLEVTTPEETCKDNDPCDQDGSPWSIRFSYDTTAVAYGQIDFSVHAEDTTGNEENSASLSIIADNEGPGIQIISPEDGEYTSLDTINIVGFVDDPSGVDSLFVGMIPVEIDNGNFDVQVSLLSGPNNFIFRALDTLSNQTTVSITINRDTFPPPLNIIAPRDGQQYNLDLGVHATASDDVALASIEVLAPAGVEDSNGDVGIFESTFDTTAVTDGGQSMTFKATDHVGNFTETTVNYTVKNTGKIGGRIFKGPVSGADVAVLDWTGGVPGSSLKVSGDPSSANGSYEVQVGPHVGPVVLRVDGGEYKGEARNNFDLPVPLQSEDYLLTVVEHQVAQELVNEMVSPFTTLAALLAGYRVTVGGEAEHDAIVDAYSRLQAVYGFDLRRTVPLDVRNVLATGFDAPAKAGLLLASLSYLGSHHYGSFNALQLLRGVFEDLEADGVLDGKGLGGAQLTLGSLNLDANTMRSMLCRGVLWFLQSSYNGSGLSETDPDILTWLDAIAASTDPVFDQDQDPLPVDIERPTITFDTHSNGDPVRLTINVKITARDNDVLSDVTITSPQGLNPSVIVIDDGIYELDFDLDTTTKADGDYPITFRATDRSGNFYDKTLTLVIDNTEPAIDWIAPVDGLHTNADPIPCHGTFVEETSGLASIKVLNRTADIVGSTWSNDLVLNEGARTITVTARDLAGNEAVLSRDIVVDRRDPVVDIPDFLWPSDRNEYPCLCWGAGCTSACNSAKSFFTLNETFFDGAQALPKRVERLVYTQPSDISANNLPVIYLYASDPWGSAGSEPEDLTVEMRYEFNSVVKRNWTALSYNEIAVPGTASTSTHQVIISSDTLSSDVAACDVDDSHSVKVRVTDESGNQIEYEYRFRIQIVPGPLEFDSTPLSGDAGDADSLYNVEPETCTRSSSRPFLTCNAGGYDALFAGTPGYSNGIRIQRLKITNPNTYPVRIRLPTTDLRGGGVHMYMIKGYRMLGVARSDPITGICNDCDPTCVGSDAYLCTSDLCPAGSIWAIQLWCLNAECTNGCSSIAGHLPSTVEDNMADLTMSSYFTDRLGSVMDPVGGHYVIPGNTHVTMYLALPKIPSSYHRYDVVDLEPDPPSYGATGPEYSYSFRGGSFVDDDKYIKVRQDGSDYYYEWNMVHSWEAGFRVSHATSWFNYGITRDDHNVNDPVDANRVDLRYSTSYTLYSGESYLSDL